MLNKLRQSTNSIYFKIGSLLIILSFISWSMSNILKGRQDEEIVTFSNISSITKSEFLRKKEEKVKQVQQSFSSNLTDDQIEKLNINNMVLNNLINLRMMDYLSYYYDLNISNNAAISEMKKFPIFHDKNGKFDYNIFSNFMKRSNLQEPDYVELVKKELSYNLMKSVFSLNYPLPGIISNNITKYLKYLYSDINFDYISIAPSIDFKNSKISENELIEFYNINKKKFITPEKRDIEYVEIPLNKISVNISDQEIEEYYQENKDDYIKPAIFSYKEITTKEENQVNEIIKNWEKNIINKNNISSIENINEESLDKNLIKSLKKKKIFYIKKNNEYRIIKPELYSPEKNISISEAKKEIKALLTQQKKEFSTKEFMDSIDDFAANSSSLEEIAKEFGLEKNQFLKLQRTKKKLYIIKLLI